MKKAPLFGTLLALACVSILGFPSSTGAITIHVHDQVVRHHVVGHDPNGPLVAAELVTTEHVERLAPPDSDDDGCANGSDHFVGPGCNPPPPPPKPAPVVATTPAAIAPPAPAPTSVPPAPVASSSGGYSIPSYIVSCESGGDYSAVNSSSGAYGAYQIMPSTASAYGCDLSTASGQDQCAAEIYADVGSSAWSCG